MKKHLLTLLALLTLSGLYVQAETQATATLVSEASSIQPGKPFWVALQVKLKDGWHVYWKNPGEAGFPTSIEWDLPEGFEADDIQYPTPKRFALDQFVNYGYEDEVLLLVPITPPEVIDSEEITIKGTAEWLVCKDECVPGDQEVSLTLKVNDTPTLNPEWASRFDAERAGYASEPIDCDIAAFYHEGTLGLLLQPKGDNKTPPGADTYFYSEDDTIKATQSQEMAMASAGYFLKLELIEDAEVPERLTGILVDPVNKTTFAIDERVKISPIVIKSMKETPYSVGLLVAMGFAFVGGLILNLMPCVFPVLSLKILGFVQQAGEDVNKVKKHGIMFGIGVLASFWALTILLLSLRAGGEQLGWGFQLQSPEFVVFLCFILTLVALNFAGLFEFGASLISTGSRFGLKSGYLGSFSSGVLATVLATPCTAPFMGTALGYALSQPALYSVAIFTMLALGMAAPYVIISFNTGLLRFLPKPGAWMESFKQFMAFPMLATVLWLVWVFNQQTSSNALFMLLFALLTLSIAAWTYGRFATFSASKTKRLFAYLFTIAFLLGSVQIAQKAVAYSENGNGDDSGLTWEEYSTQRLQELLSKNKPVYIDFTAAWCLTCQANKANVFGSDNVIASLKNKEFTLLKADWTSKDDEITQALQAYGRSGVPTNVIYGEGPNAEAKLLPSVLTAGIVLDELNNT